MRRRPLLLGVLVWLLVVTAASGVTWAVIDGAGESVLTDGGVDETDPAPAAPTASFAPTTSLRPTSTPRPSRPPSAQGSSPTTLPASPAPPRATADAPDPGGSAVPDTAPGVRRTWEGTPGQVTVRCVAGRPRLDSATPSNGYRFEVEQEGPGELEVKFESATREFKVEARCVGTVPRFAVESDEA